MDILKTATILAIGLAFIAPLAGLAWHVWNDPKRVAKRQAERVRALRKRAF